MKDDFFYDVTDQIAPFGDDDSWETFMALQDWIPNHTNRNKLEFLHSQLSYWGYPPFDLSTTDIEVIKEYIQTGLLHDRYLYGTDEAIIATAFGQLYLEGRIDLNIRNLAVIAIKRQTLPELMAVYPEQRRSEILVKYNKLLSILSPEP